MIKVNQITSVAHTSYIKSRVNCLGVCIAKSQTLPMITTKTLEAIRENAPSISLSISFNKEDNYTPTELSEILKYNSAQFYEFTPVDFLKKSDFEIQLKFLEQLPYEKIANGFFIVPDETTFLDNIKSLKMLEDVGVKLFQFEIESAVATKSRLDIKTLYHIENLSKEISILICDNFTTLHNYPIKGATGFYFNIKPTLPFFSYDHSELNFSLGHIMKILSTK